MRLPFFSMFVTSPFDALQEHAEKVKECSWAFQQAMECYASARCDTFEDLRQEVSRFENEAASIKQRIRSQLPKGVMMPVEKFQLFQYLREQDSGRRSDNNGHRQGFIQGKGLFPVIKGVLPVAGINA